MQNLNKYMFLKLLMPKLPLAFFISFTFISSLYCGSGYKRDTLYQISTINALMEGVFDGTSSVGELKAKGDFGIGTFNGVDGEMVMIGGKVYKIRSDGYVYNVKNSELVPFAEVTFFDNDKSLVFNKNINLKQFQSYIDSILTSKNVIYAVKMEGSFKYIKTRSVPKQNKPYSSLLEVTKNQAVFEFENIKGTIIGFRIPSYLSNVNMPGYHFHFLSENKKSGGHLLDFIIDYVSIELDKTPAFFMVIPETNEFENLDMQKNNEKELEKAEK